MDDQIPSASTPVFKIKTKSRQRSTRPYERPSQVSGELFFPPSFPFTFLSHSVPNELITNDSFHTFFPQSWGGKIVDSVSSISDWLKSAASYLTNSQPEGEIDVNEQPSVLSNSSSRSTVYNEMPSEIRDASIRPSLCVLREEEEENVQEPNVQANEVNVCKAAPTAASTPYPSSREARGSSLSMSEEVRTAPVASAVSTSSDFVSLGAPISRDTSTRLSIGTTMNRLDIPEDNLKRLKSNLSKRNRYSLPCSNISTSPPCKASRHETSVDSSSSTRIARNSDIFGVNSTLSSSFTYGPRSPFYDGRTSFGGSSSRRMSRLAFPYSMGTRKIAPILKVRASEMAKSDCGRSEALSCASLKILDVINKESSLLEDTKKIPLNDSSGLSNKAVFNNFVHSTRRVSSSKPIATTRLSMPSHITTSLLNRSINSIHQSTADSNLDWRLNPTSFADDTHAGPATAAAAAAAATVTSAAQSTSVVEQPSVHSRSVTGTYETSNVSRERGGGKMKTCVTASTSNRSLSKSNCMDESVPVVNLPQVSLPPLKNLPSFNLDCNKTSDASSTNDLNQFKFSWPSVNSESSRDVYHEVTTTAKAFTFSNPLADTCDSTSEKVSVNPITIPQNGSSVTSSSSPTVAVTSDASWSCPKCIYRNDPQVNQCLACKTLKKDINCNRSNLQSTVKCRDTISLAPSSSSISSSSSSSNAAAILTAVAASSATTNVTTTVTTTTTGTSASASFSSFTTASSWGDKFKKPPGSWVCDVCMVDNKSENNQCVACETPKSTAQSTTTGGGASNSTYNSEFTNSNTLVNSSTISNVSKKWTCDTCYVKNDENRDTCSSCEMSRKANEIGNKQASYSGYKFNLSEKNPPPFTFGTSSSLATSIAPIVSTATQPQLTATAPLVTAPTQPLSTAATAPIVSTPSLLQSTAPTTAAAPVKSLAFNSTLR